MIVERVARFLSDPASEPFDRLVRDAFVFQCERILPLRELCTRRGVRPGELDSWRRIPPIPALAFKSLRLAAAAPVETFRSSGTTGVSPSIHYHPFPDLYRAVIEASFPAACLLSLRQPPMLSLIPTREQLPHSSLGFMIEHVLRRWAASASTTAFGPGGVQYPRARSWLAARQRDGVPVLILTTAFALAEVLDRLERADLRFRLAAGSTIFETGGFKGKTREVPRRELLERVEQRLAIPARQVVREYGMTELTSQFYTRTLSGGDPDLFWPPHWTRVRILDPESLEELGDGEVGLVCVLDLANLGSAIHLLTEDLGVAEGGGFRLCGRAAGSELRGCSLTVEELQAG